MKLLGWLVKNEAVDPYLWGGGGSKIRGIFGGGGVSKTRIVVFGGLYWRPPQNYHGTPYDPFFNKTVVFMGPVLGCMFVRGLSND